MVRLIRVLGAMARERGGKGEEKARERQGKAKPKRADPAASPGGREPVAA
jgi:hypothetical protein